MQGLESPREAELLRNLSLFTPLRTFDHCRGEVVLPGLRMLSLRGSFGKWLKSNGAAGLESRTSPVSIISASNHTVILHTKMPEQSTTTLHS